MDSCFFENGFFENLIEWINDRSNICIWMLSKFDFISREQWLPEYIHWSWPGEYVADYTFVVRVAQIKAIQVLVIQRAHS